MKLRWFALLLVVLSVAIHGYQPTPVLAAECGCSACCGLNGCLTCAGPCPCTCWCAGGPPGVPSCFCGHIEQG